MSRTLYFERVLDTRKLYLVLLITLIVGFIISLYSNNIRITIYFFLILLIIMAFKKHLSLYGKIVYLKWKMKN